MLLCGEVLGVAMGSLSQRGRALERNLSPGASCVSFPDGLFGVRVVPHNDYIGNGLLRQGMHRIAQGTRPSVKLHRNETYGAKRAHAGRALSQNAAGKVSALHNKHTSARGTAQRR